METLTSIAVFVVVLVVVLLVVFSLISAGLGAIARPKGGDLEFVTSSAADEAVIEFRVANARLREVEPNMFFGLLAKSLDFDVAAAGSFYLIKKLTGGMWVGGRVILTTHRIIFLPNAMNRAVTRDLQAIALLLSDVTEVSDRFGVGSRIIDVETPGGALTFRCPRSRQFKEAVAQALPGK